MSTDDEGDDDEEEEKQQQERRSCTAKSVNNEHSSQIRSTPLPACSVNKDEQTGKTFPKATRKTTAAAAASTTTSSHIQSQRAVSSTASSAASPSTSTRKRRRQKSRQKTQPTIYSLKSEAKGRFFVPCQTRIPLVDEFRRKMAAEGNVIFSGFDLASGYYQLPVETKDVDYLFGFRSLGRVFILQRLSMGWATSPGIFHAIMQRIFEKQVRAHIYLDDIQIASKSVQQHVEEDLPHALAICSRYNILLKAQKCDLAKSETSVRLQNISISHLSFKKRSRTWHFRPQRKNASQRWPSSLTLSPRVPN